MSMLPLSINSHKKGFVDQRHTLCRAQAFGQHGGEDVGFFGVGECGRTRPRCRCLLDSNSSSAASPFNDGILQQLRDTPRARASVR